MKILYAIQATGNGHIARAKEIIPILQRKGDLDILMSGIQSDIDLGFQVKYKFHGLSFIFGKKGGIDYYQTYAKNRVRKFLNEIKNLAVADYDLIINDFEPISAWAAKRAKKTCIGLSNQSAVLSLNAPQPKFKDPIGKLVLKRYAPVSKSYGFHFERYNEQIYTPIIRSEVRNMKITNKGHYTVYLPSFEDKKIIKRLTKFKDIKWEVFSKHSDKEYEVENIKISPITNSIFLESMASCEGILCGAGFATPSEAIFLKKKLMVIPMKMQYEQQCNAQALKRLGIATINSLKKKHLPQIEKWITFGKAPDINYPDLTESIINRIITENVKPKLIRS